MLATAICAIQLQKRTCQSFVYGAEIVWYAKKPNWSIRAVLRGYSERREAQHRHIHGQKHHPLRLQPHPSYYKPHPLYVTSHAHPRVATAVHRMSVSSVVLPGDELGADSSVVLGPGTRRDDGGTAYSTVAGVVRGREGRKIWVDFNSKRVCSSFR